MDSKLSNNGIEEYTFLEETLMNSNKKSMNCSISLEKLSIMILKNSDKNCLREHTIKYGQPLSIGTKYMAIRNFHFRACLVLKKSHS